MFKSAAWKPYAHLSKLSNIYFLQWRFIKSHLNHLIKGYKQIAKNRQIFERFESSGWSWAPGGLSTLPHRSSWVGGPLSKTSSSFSALSLSLSLSLLLSLSFLMHYSISGTYPPCCCGSMIVLNASLRLLGKIKTKTLTKKLIKNTDKDQKHNSISDINCVVVNQW